MSIEVRNLTYIYGANSVYERKALDDVSLTINEGEFIGIIGHTGSGKSTLIQHLNGLLKATSGDILYQGESIYGQGFSMKELRGKVGLVFQYPEYQLFETTVLRDVAYGPKNQGLDEVEATKKAQEALLTAGISETFWQMSPFELSGGQKRRVAIAGVLAMEPEILILDEPTAGLDPKGRRELFAQICELQKAKGITVILVSHSMEDVADYVTRLVVMNEGKIMYDGEPASVFVRYKELEAAGLAAPQVTYLMHELKEKGFPVDTNVITIEQAKEEILKIC
ncbi:MAG: energy-coupling factor transporter ATPase [Eubacterium sp.]|nr:energy-coupling factor transporter ATPase [Eubacterium sp.]